MMFHPVAWLFWLIAAALPPLLTRNPLYLSLALLATWITYTALARRNPTAQPWSSFVRLGAMLWLLTVPFTMLTVHYGNIVLFRLPGAWPVVGGPITGEALLFGLSSGLSIITLLLAFATFNVAVDQAKLLRLTPGFLYQAGIITAIAIAFVPQMIATWQSIREAQEVRGHRVRGLRDLLPLIMPLLVTALERATRLAESMEARGFGRQLQPASPVQRVGQQASMLGALALMGAGFAAAGFWPDRGLLAGSLLIGGALLLATSLWDQGRRVERSRYRRWYWTSGDKVVLGIGVAGTLGWLAVWLAHGNAWLLYYPYPPYSPWPGFEPALGVLAILPAAAGLFIPSERAARQMAPEASDQQPVSRPPRGASANAEYSSTVRAASTGAVPAEAPVTPGSSAHRRRVRLSSLVLRMFTIILFVARR